MAENTAVRRVTIAGQPFVLRRSDVLRALRRVEPEPIYSHFVVVGSRRFPPKRVVGEVTGLDRDGAEHSNWGILDVASMRWISFQGKPLSNVVRGLTS